MRFVTFSLIGTAARRIGAQILANSGEPNGDFEVVDLSTVPALTGKTMRGFLEMGKEGRSIAEAAIESPSSTRIPKANVKLLAPIYDAEKVICIGMNYHDHCAEQGIPTPTEPILFSKFASSIAADGDDIPLEHTTELDFEVELAVVIGQKARNVSAEAAIDYVAGYMTAHDVSARDYQLKKNGGQWLLGKCMDGYAPVGPALVTSDEIGAAEDLDLKCTVNGAVMQSGNTREMVFGVRALIAYITRFFTLNPGDIILTGTPPGVGCFRKPPVFLADGDVVTVEIQKIGAITNKVRAVSGGAAQ